MKINEMTIGEAKELARMFDNNHSSEGPYRVGDKVLIRTVTMTQVGRIIEVYPGEIVLEGGSWVGDTGRFGKALAEGTLDEVEAVPGRYIVGRGAICDCCEWRHDLPTVTK